MAINELVKQRRIELGLTLGDVAKAVGVSEATVSRWESGHIDDMKRGRIAALAKILRISPLSLISDEVDEHPPIILQKVEYKKRIPILGRVAAGLPLYAEENIEGYVNVENPDLDYALRIKGNSMEPTLHDGSLIYIQQDGEYENGTIVVACVNGDESTVKRYHKYGNRVILRPDNINYDEQEYSAADVHILGIVKSMKVDF
ncbi:MAG: helix-turn-helix domain-containing protein [Clostridiales Family XIII bacterium]|jgi:repressor LexA|nr:helix-turn-helix domain-containing protein [Clostridiales Family XIII bacterium]